MERVISAVRDLEALRSRGARRGIDRVSLELGLPGSERRRLEGALNHGLRSCGCETGAILVLTGLTIQLGVALLGAAPLRRPTAFEIGRFGLVLLALAMTGKIVGLLLAEWRFRRAINEIVRRPAADHGPVGVTPDATPVS